MLRRSLPLLSRSLTKFVGHTNPSCLFSGRLFEGAVSEIHEKVYDLVLSASHNTKVNIAGVVVDFADQFSVAGIQDDMKGAQASDALKDLFKQQVHPKLFVGVPQAMGEECAVLIMGGREVSRISFHKIGSGTYSRISTTFRSDVLLDFLSGKEEKRSYSLQTSFTEYFLKKEENRGL